MAAHFPCQTERLRRRVGCMETDRTPITVPALQWMKSDGRKIVGVVAWDYPMAQIVDRAGADLVSVGDTVGVNLWGHASPLEITLAEMLVVCKAVRRGVKRALVSCDFPFGPLQEGADSAVRAAILLVKEAGADMVKLDGAADFPEAVRAVARAGIPVFAQMGITPQTALRYGVPYSAASKPGAQVSADMTNEAGGGGQAAGRCRREFDRFHELGSRGGRGGGCRGCDSGGGRLWRRAVARRAHAYGACGDRVCGGQCGCAGGELRQCREDRVRRDQRVRRGRARGAADQGRGAGYGAEDVRIERTHP